MILVCFIVNLVYFVVSLMIWMIMMREKWLFDRDVFIEGMFDEKCFWFVRFVFV